MNVRTERGGAAARAAPPAGRRRQQQDLLLLFCCCVANGQRTVAAARHPAHHHPAPAPPGSSGPSRVSRQHERPELRITGGPDDDVARGRIPMRRHASPHKVAHALQPPRVLLLLLQAASRRARGQHTAQSLQLRLQTASVKSPRKQAPGHPQRGFLTACGSSSAAVGGMARLVPCRALEVLNERLVNPTLPQIPEVCSSPTAGASSHARTPSVTVGSPAEWVVMSNGGGWGRIESNSRVEGVEDLRIHLVEARAAVIALRVHVLEVICSGIRLAASGAGSPGE